MNHILLSLIGISALAGASAARADDIYQSIYNSVDKNQLITQLKNLTGVNPVTVNDQTFSIRDRYLPESKAKFRAYWKSYFESLGMTVSEMAYPTAHNVGEREGHNLEAILPGQSKDSIVIIVHYDSIGPWEDPAGNPGVDDDMTGMAMMLETARILTSFRDKLQHTVRFVAADYEEHGNLEGARQYVKHLKSASDQEGFKIVAAIDNEQSGWNCALDGSCPDRRTDTFDVFSCSWEHDFHELGDALEKVASTYSDLKVKRNCIGPNSDNYAFWEEGIPAVVFSEHAPFQNPHFDQMGGDTFDKIDQNYFFRIAQVGVTFAVQLIGIAP